MKGIVSENYSLHNWHDIFVLDPDTPTGLRWKISIGSGRYGKIFKAKAGNIAGQVVSTKGKSYYRFQYNKKKFFVHRVIMIMRHGLFDRNLVVNHIDGNGLNNSYDNLEICTQSKNNLCKVNNVTRSVLDTGNITGYKGVHYVLAHKKTPLYRAMWTDQYGKKRAKEFTIHVYGEEEALRLAIEAYRQGNEERMSYFEKERLND